MRPKNPVAEAARPARPVVQASLASVRPMAPHVAAALRPVSAAPASRTAQAKLAPLRPMAPHVASAVARPAPAVPALRTAQASRPTHPGALRAAPAKLVSSVQPKMKFGRGTDYLNIEGAGAGITLSGYRETLREAIDMKNEVEVEEGIPRVGTAMYTPIPREWAGTITIRPLSQADVDHKTEAYNSRLIAMAHETRHAIDDLTKLVRYRNSDEEKIHTEWRAFATQSAVAWELAQGNQPVEDRYLLDIASFASRQAFMAADSRMVETTQSYMRVYGMNSNPSVADAQDFMQQHLGWVDEAIALFGRLKPQRIDEPVAQNLRPARVDANSWRNTLIAAGLVAGTIASAYLLPMLARYFGLIR